MGHWLSRDTVKLSIQHVPKSTAPTELTELVKGDGEIPIPLLHSISVSFGIYGYPTISPIGRIKVTVSYLHCEGGKDKTFSFGIKLDLPNLANQKSHGGDRKTSDKMTSCIKVSFQMSV